MKSAIFAILLTTGVCPSYAADTEFGQDEIKAIALAKKDGANPTLAYDATNRIVYAAWAQRHTSGVTPRQDIVLARSENKGQSFADPVIVSTGDLDVETATSNPAQVVVAANGDVYVLYHRHISDKKLKLERDIPRIVRSVDGGKTFSRPVNVLHGDEPDTSAGMSNLVVGPDNTVQIAWLDTRTAIARGKLSKDKRPQDLSFLDADDAPVQVRFATAKPGDLHFSRSVLIADGASEHSRVSLALDKDGRIYALWRTKANEFKNSYDAVRDVVLSSSSDAGQSWSTPVKVHEDRFKAGDCPEVTTGLGVDSKARVHVAWYTGGGLAPGVYYASSDDHGRSFGKPVALLTDRWVPYANVKLTLDKHDQAWIAYEDRREQNAERSMLVHMAAPGVFSRVTNQPGLAPDLVSLGDLVVLALNGSSSTVTALSVPAFR